jgi:hypothetical protein
VRGVGRDHGTWPHSDRTRDGVAHLTLALAPFVLATRTQAFFMFLGFNALAIVWIAYRLTRSVLPWSIATWGVVAAGIALSSLTQVILITGQIYPLLLLISPKGWVYMGCLVIWLR